MVPSEGYTVIAAPREGVNDDVVRVVDWLVAEGVRIDARQSVALLETAKSTFELQADRAGYLYPVAKAGAEVPVGMPLALIADQARRPIFQPQQAAVSREAPDDDQVVTKKARLLIQEHGLLISDFAGLAVVRSEDVQELLQKRDAETRRPAMRKFRGEGLDPSADWDAVNEVELFGQFRELLSALRKRMKARFNRHVPVGDLLYDRWDLAKDYGFGEDTSVYDECLILGDVRVGRHSWVGPYTILDGNLAPLRIGDYVDIGAGTHIYTHNSIERALTGHRAPLFGKPTTIGNCCFIAPNVVIAPGTVLGDHCFVAAGSYVEGNFPTNSYIAGSPAKRIGTVEVGEKHAKLRRFQSDDAYP